MTTPPMNTAGKWTPGPWSLVPLKGHRKFSILGPDVHKWNGCRKSVAQSGASYASQRLANARLISAAPDLYEALTVALRFIENTEGEFGITLDSGDLARAALAKARGEA